MSDTGFPMPDAGLRIADCGQRLSSVLRHPSFRWLYARGLTRHLWVVRGPRGITDTVLLVLHHPLDALVDATTCLVDAQGQVTDICPAILE